MYNIDFYRQVLSVPLKTCFKYLAYLSLIGAVLATLAFSFYVFPELNRTAQWAEREFPDITWTPEGIVMNAPSPYEMFHPDMGAVIVFDTNVDEINPETMGNVYALVTATNLYLRRDGESVVVYDLTRDPAAMDPSDTVAQVTGANIKETYDNFVPLLFLIVPLFSFVVIFFFKVMEAVVYSLVALAICALQKKQLPNEQLFKLAAFALTAAAFLQWRGFIHPALGVIPFGIIGGLLVTGGYLFWILKHLDNTETVSQTDDTL